MTNPTEQRPTQALIKRIRAFGLTQSEIARRTNIPQPRLSRWENGEVANGADDALTLQALADELDSAHQPKWDGVDRRKAA